MEEEIGLFWLKSSFFFKFTNRKNPGLALVVSGFELLVEGDETDEVVDVELHELLLAHTVVSVWLAHLTQEESNRRGHFVLLWDPERHCAHLSHQLFLAAGLPRRDSDHHFIADDPNRKNVTLWRVDISLKGLQGHVERGADVLTSLDLTICKHGKAEIS